MFWKRVKELPRTLTFRVGVWYASIFLISAVLLLWLVYFLLGAAINRKDRDMIEARLREYVSVYQHGGIPTLRDWTGRVNKARAQRMFFVRVAKSDGTVELVVMPEDWSEHDLDMLGDGTRVLPKGWTRIVRDPEMDLTVASTILQDGTIFQVGRSSESRSILLAKFRQVFLVIIVPVIVLGLSGGIILTNRMMRPVRNVIAAAMAIISTGRMDVRVPVRAADDELRDLAVLFNRMLECNEELFRALRDSLDNVAHDLRTPLARLRATLEDALQDQKKQETVQEYIGQALEETDRVQTIIDTLMEVARAEAGLMKLRIAQTDIGALIKDAVELYAHVAEDKNVSVATQFSNGCSAAVDAVRMRQVFANLLDNAIRHTPSAGQVSISASPRDGEIEVKVRDTGVGINETELPRIWERLYRGDKSRSEHGLGLGLNLVKAIVEAHRGRVEVSSVPCTGSEFRVYLPFSKAVT
jgi:signal transduction histidine kinase